MLGGIGKRTAEHATVFELALSDDHRGIFVSDVSLVCFDFFAPKLCQREKFTVHETRGEL